MIQLLLVYALAVGSITAAPQLLDFNNGGVGVNFGGYSARAGLGGLLTGNAADGGLSASAGTPFGQRAAAGLGGTVNGGNAAGGLFAGAQANDEVGASAGIAGSTGAQSSGVLGAESHTASGGKSVTKTVVQDTQTLTVPTTVQKVTTVQKIKPPKKYVTQTNIASSVSVVTAPAVTVVKTYNRPLKRRYKYYSYGPAARNVGVFKQVSYVPLVSKRFGGEEQVAVAQPTTYKTVQTVDYPVVTKQIQYSPATYLNIPIGILKSLQTSLQPIGYSKQVSIFG